MRIGNTKRPDNFTKKEALPGPGNYIEDTGTFGKNTKGGANMGSKHKAVVSDTPGPGAYSGDHNAIKTSKSQYGKIGTTKRPNLWESRNRNAPGPGNYNASHNTFGKNVKGVAGGMGSKHKTERNFNPGPG